MKKILNVFILDNGNALTEPPDGAEYFVLSDADLFNRPKQRVLKAKGKYSVIARGMPDADGLKSFLSEIEKLNVDLIAFDGGSCFKTGVVRNLSTDTADIKMAEILCAMDCKSIYQSDKKPFEAVRERDGYSYELKCNILKAIEKFNSERSKLPKEIYSYVFNLICCALEAFYASAMLAVYNKHMKADELVDFDLKLKENIVLYLALEKRFSACDLKKQRQKKFRISFLTANKLKKYRNT